MRIKIRDVCETSKFELTICRGNFFTEEIIPLAKKSYLKDT